MEKFQLIDGDCAFNDGFSAFLERFKEAMQGDYLVLGVIGAQSSGKSTLLNALFGADFEVMDARVERRQTTRGVWLAVLPAHRLVVLDIEGSDSRERWESKSAVERRTALFGLALSNLLVVNVWHREIGRFSANNYEILKTAFEINLRDFGRDAPKKLLFAVRDFDERERVDALAQLLLEDVQRLWGESRKPLGLETAPLNQLLSVDVAALAHAKFAGDAFARDVAALRRRLLDAAADDYVFARYRARALPFDALAEYARRVWEVVASNAELDIPNQKLVVSSCRAEEIRRETLEKFERQIAELSESPPTELSAKLSALRANALAAFGEATLHYDAKAVAAPARALGDALSEKLFRALKALTERESDAFIAKMETSLRASLRAAAELPSALALAAERKAAAVAAHSDLLAALCLSAEQRAQLAHAFALRVDSEFARFLHANADAMLTRWRRSLAREAEERAFECFQRLGAESLARFNAAVAAKLAAVSAHCERVQQNEEFRAVFGGALLESFQKELRVEVSNAFKARTLSIPDALLQNFRARFETSEKGARRNWHCLTDAEIEKAFRVARAAVEPSLAALERPITLEWDASPIVSADELAPLRSEAVARIAQRREIAYSVKYNRNSLERIPGWLWAVLIYFIHDNVLSWFTSPTVIFWLFVLGAALAYLVVTGRAPAALGVVQLGAAPLLDGGRRLLRSASAPVNSIQ